MMQRASAYNVEPGVLKLEHGLAVLKERQLMGVLREATDPSTDRPTIEKSLRAVRSDPFLHKCCAIHSSFQEIKFQLRRTEPKRTRW